MSEESERHMPLVIIGPSGAGKSSVAKLLCERHGYTLVKTVTTRPQRDAFDTDHEFISPETFETMRRGGEFFGILEVFGAQYGLPRFNPTERVVLLLRAPALPEFLTRFPEACIVEIDAPLDVLKKRLSRRTTENRFNPEFLEKEIAAGRSMARIIFDSSLLTSEDIARRITRGI